MAIVLEEEEVQLPKKKPVPVKSELVSITIDLPFSYGNRVNYIEVGNRKFYDMKTYDVTPELARDLRWIMEQTIRHDHAVKGESSLNLNTLRSLTRRNK